MVLMHIDKEFLPQLERIAQEYAAPIENVLNMMIYLGLKQFAMREQFVQEGDSKEDLAFWFMG